jgi:uncharacterized protein (TIGR02118 family)
LIAPDAAATLGYTQERGRYMARLIAIYRTPKDPDAFDRHYAATHAPLARTMPGLRSYDISRGPVASPSGAPGVHLIATLAFDSVADIEAALGSEEGRATAADLANFADGGVELYVFETADAPRAA